MTVPPAPVQRLRYIDMARAVAILLMLEGHFVDVTLAPEWRIPGNAVYDIWLHCRGLAAVAFFTVTGLIFSFLMSGAAVAGGSFFQQRRVRRGLKRVLELLFWGYLIQVNLREIPKMLAGNWPSWMGAFHVLQCIAVGLLVIISAFGLTWRSRAWVRMIVFFVLGMGFFLFAQWLANQAGHVPANAPAWLQNAFKGRWVNFPVAPWLGFTCYGAALGAWVRQLRDDDRGNGAYVLLIAGFVLSRAGWPLDDWLAAGFLDLLGIDSAERTLVAFFHGRFGETLLIIGALAWIEGRFRPQAKLLCTVGRNTFPIYVGHVILLYGGITGFGISRWLGDRLGPWSAAIGAILFCGLFFAFAQVVEPLMELPRRLRARTGKGS
ncbi:MAG: DUF1624 domain-containing protein [Verrucomicrobiae bacterium]|nr:DUF1624 domain-containing protein [Verrucomicrobiae bacterium]MCP5544020.1 DUF1624 domain-containing protein [Akkermansiaceae bacterium]